MMRSSLTLPLVLAASLAACQTNPYTGRSQALLTSEAEEMQMGVEAYAQMSADEPVSQDPALNDPLVRVGRAIAAAADEDRRKHGDAPFAWEFKVIARDDTLNAWCLPGGKIAFYTGIYPVCSDEAGMAIVMGHEVSHALLRHGGERIAHGTLTQAALAAGDLLSRGSEHRDYILGALGMGAQVGVLLPYSRSHESEADRYVLMLAARAGYDPRAAIRVWKTMAKLSAGRPPEFLSTHPDPLNRVENMRQWMPEAVRLYEASQQRENRPLPAIGK